MAQRNRPSGCGCLVLFFLLPFVVSLAVAVPGIILAAPAIVAFLMVENPKQIATYPSWWVGVALAPLVAYLVVRLASRGKDHPQHRIHLVRAGILAVLCAVMALLAMVLDQRYLGGTATDPLPSARAEQRLRTVAFALPMVAPATAVATALLFYAVLKLLDRKVPNQVIPRLPSTGSPDWLEPQPQEIWWGEVEFRQGDGSKDRPFVILRVLPTHLEILQITSQDKSDRNDHIPFWTDSTDPYAVADGWLELRIRQLSRYDLRRRDAAVCPDEIWSRVRSMTAAESPRPRTA
jgi:hypothetical protein